MLRLLTSAIAFTFVSSTAFAADLPLPEEPMPATPVATTYDWTGFYLGLNGGWGWGDTEHSNNLGVTTDDFDIDGAFAGGQVGYNFHWNRFVLGAETDIQWSDIGGSSGNAVCFPDTCETDINWFGTVRGRAGVAFDRILIYGTGGLAYGEVEAACCGGGFDVTDTNVGWTAGGGVEVGITRNLSFKGEYLFMNLDDVSEAVGAGLTVTADAEHTNLVWGGINWRFGGRP